MSSEPQSALVRAAQAGDERARDRLTAAYLPLVYNIVGRALNGHTDTDDVVQETMLRVLDGLGSLRSPESFRSWLVAITMNQLRGYWRRYGADGADGTAPVSLEDAHAAPPVEDFVDATVLRLGLSGQRYETAQATRWLEEGDQALLSLWWLEAAGQLSRAEVAAAMELSAQHTAVRVQRMKAQLESARVVVRALAAQPRCARLESIAAGWDGAPSPLWRKRLARHTRECAVCSGRSWDLVPAERLLVGLALVPLVSSAFTAGASEVAAHGVAHHAGPAHAGGPRPGPASGPGRAVRRKRSRRRRRATGLAAVAVLVSTGAGVVHLTTGPEKGGERAADVTSRAASGPPERSARAEPSPSPSKSSASPSASRSASPSPSRTSKKPAKPRPSTPPPKPKPEPTTREPAPPPRGPSAQVAALVNEERAKKGCGPVTTNSQLDAASAGHSSDMAARDFFDHNNPDGEGPGERITAAGYRWSTYGENIAKGQSSPEAVMRGWMDSPGHRANILNCSFKEMGLGLKEGPGGPWWTQAFGAR